MAAPGRWHSTILSPTWLPPPHSSSGSLPPTQTTWPCLEYTFHKHRRRTDWFGKHKLCVSDQLQNSQHTHKCQMLSSQEKSSFIQLTPTSSENGENGAMLGHCYLGTFILITEALGNRCLVTNTFETDLLMLWKDLRVRFTDREK